MGCDYPLMVLETPRGVGVLRRYRNLPLAVEKLVPLTRGAFFLVLSSGSAVIADREHHKVLPYYILYPCRLLKLTLPGNLSSGGTQDTRTHKYSPQCDSATAWLTTFPHGHDIDGEQQTWRLSRLPMSDSRRQLSSTISAASLGGCGMPWRYSG